MANDRPISQQLRETILRASETPHDIALAVGIHDSILSKFLNGKQGLNSKNMDLLAAYFGITLNVPKRKAKRVIHGVA